MDKQSTATGRVLSRKGAKVHTQPSHNPHALRTDGQHLHPLIYRYRARKTTQ